MEIEEFAIMGFVWTFIYAILSLLMCFETNERIERLTEVVLTERKIVHVLARESMNNKKGDK